MRVVKKALMGAWFVCVAVLLGCVLLEIMAGRRADDLLIGTAGGATSLITGLLFLGWAFGERGFGFLDPRALFSVLCFGFGVVCLSAGGLLPESVRVWAGVFCLAWFALMILWFGAVLLAAEREERKNRPASAAPRPADSGRRTNPLLGPALLLMFWGVVAVVLAVKCLVVGPPPYSPLAYVIGPVLIVAGYLVDPHAIRHLRDGFRKPPQPPAGESR